MGRSERYLHMAMGVALTSTARMKHGAIVVRQHHVLGYSPNLVKNDPKYVNWKYSSIHAEIAALRKANFPRRATIYVARVNRQNQARMSKPCINCQEVIDGLKCKVVWTEG